jgi:hypothetical protein
VHVPQLSEVGQAEQVELVGMKANPGAHPPAVQAPFDVQDVQLLAHGTQAD